MKKLIPFLIGLTFLALLLLTAYANIKAKEATKYAIQQEITAEQANLNAEKAIQENEKAQTDLSKARLEINKLKRELEACK